MSSTLTDRRLGLVGSVAFKPPCDCATLANITLSGEQTIDGILTSSSRVLVKSQTNSVENGIYDTSTAAWTRSIDSNGNYDFRKGTQVYVAGGSAQGGVAYTLTTANPITIDTSALVFAVSTAVGSLAAQLASASNGQGADLVGGVGRVVATIAALKALLKTGAGKAFVLGYYAAGDGGGGQYWYDSTDTTTADNGGAVIVAADGGRWKLIITGSAVSVKQFGAYGDNSHDDTAAIQACINWVQVHTDPNTYLSKTPSLGTVSVYVPAGYYLVSAALVVLRKLTIFGDGTAEFSGGSRLISTASADLIQLNPIAGGASFGLRDITLSSNVNGTGHLVNTLGTTCNSQRYENVCFGNPQQYSLLLVGGDITVKNCLFDVSGRSGLAIALGTLTASQIAFDVRIEGCNFFNVVTRCITAFQCKDVIVTGNQVTQPSSSFNTGTFFDASAAPASLCKQVSINNNEMDSVQLGLVMNAVCLDVAFNGNHCWNNATWTAGYHFVGTIGGVTGFTMVGNTISGNFGTWSVYGDAAISILNVNISDNNFTATGGAGQALMTGATTGVIRNNTTTGYAAQSVGEKRPSSGTSFAPGLIGAGLAVIVSKTVTGAALGDRVDFSPVLGAWPVAVGIEMRGYVSAANTATVTYRNYTAGGLTPAAHDLVLEVSR